MKNLVSLICLLLVIATSTHAQAPQLYAEVGGPSIIGINFDTRFSKKENGLGGRLGMGGFSVEGDGLWMIPVGINYLVSKPGSTDFFELGLNLTYVSAKSNGGEADKKNNLADTWGSFTFGYRHQPKEAGITYRVSWNPFFAFQNRVFWPFYAGVSVGYKFK